MTQGAHPSPILLTASRSTFEYQNRSINLESRTTPGGAVTRGSNPRGGTSGNRLWQPVLRSAVPTARQGMRHYAPATPSLVTSSPIRLRSMAERAALLAEHLGSVDFMDSATGEAYTPEDLKLDESDGDEELVGVHRLQAVALATHGKERQAWSGSRWPRC